ncbi:patatin-like phospholipase family protein [Pseudactinotalea terrae]|uniref:patatin-like phospholipase family protein n=1 Tax=Pseudactinotalea terrae TaxID=1743262 RepID=UPI0019D5D49D|nr:patatin-like phospholipase family protein [Pseudactinotalea terrae]
MDELARWLRQAPFLPRKREPDGVPHPPTDPRLGLVLSGGGARSSFQIGALRYLYDEVGITPSVIAGTSAGSILASVLAQHGEHAGQRDALSQLERIWLGMTSSSDMFTEYPWFARLRAHMPTWRKVLALRQRTSHEGAEEQSTAWKPSTALEALGTLWEAGRSSADLQLIVNGPTQERAAFMPGPIVDRLLEPHVFDPERLAASPVTLRIALVGLESGELRYVTNTGTFTDRQDRPVPELGEVDVVEAIRASCAIPGVFPPVPLAGEYYVDGGVRENLPTEVALDHLGVSECYAVVASPSGVRTQQSFAAADIFTIIMRSTSGIMSDELQRDEIAYARAHGATVIAPTVDVHDLVTIDPGLISIAVDYGFLRARDVVTGADAQRQHLTDEIIRTRRRAWETEEAAFAHGTASDDDVRALKTELRDLLAEVPPGELPEGADRWWQTWERHAFEIEQALAVT